MELWTKENIINYTSDPDKVNDKKYPKEFQELMEQYNLQEW